MLTRPSRRDILLTAFATGVRDNEVDATRAPHLMVPPQLSWIPPMIGPSRAAFSRGLSAEGLPRTLVILHPSWLPRWFVPRFAEGVHWSWWGRARLCPCGQRHRENASDFDVCISVGRERLSEEVLTINLLPPGAVPSGGNPWLRADPVSDFDTWASNVMRTLLEPLYVPGLIGINFADVKMVLSYGGRYDFHQRLEHEIWSTEKSLLFSRRAHRNFKAALVGIVGGTDITLATVNDVAITLSDTLGEDADIMFYSNVYADERARISVIVKAA